MRRSQVQRIDSVIRDFLGETNIGKKLKEVSLITSWEKIMGKMIASRTDKIYIKNDTLYLRLTSPVLKNELAMMRQDIIDRMNEAAGEKLVSRVVIL
jgi:hypothetical protein